MVDTKQRVYTLVIDKTNFDLFHNIPVNFSRLLDLDLKPNAVFEVEHQFFGEALEFFLQEQPFPSEIFHINCNLQTNGITTTESDSYAPINIAFPKVLCVLNNDETVVRLETKKNKFICQNLFSVNFLHIFFYSSDSSLLPLPDLSVEPESSLEEKMKYMQIGKHIFTFKLIE